MKTKKSKPAVDTLSHSLSVKEIVSELLANNMKAKELLKAEQNLEALLTSAELVDLSQESLQLMVDWQACLSSVFILNKKIAFGVDAWAASRRLSAQGCLPVSPEIASLKQDMSHLQNLKRKSQIDPIL